jgi:IS5 family transposase
VGECLEANEGRFLREEMNMSRQERQRDFADACMDEQLRKIYEISDFLPRLKRMVPWESFRPELAGVHEKQEASGVGAPAYDVILMFKILILQAIYGLGEYQLQAQICDRLSFRDFLDLAMSDRVPDATTIWLFREKLVKKELEATLFDRFHDILAESGVTLKGGTIVDSTFVEVPRPRNTKEENEAIKRGEIPKTLTENPRRAAQKDCEARATSKRGRWYFGYKDHVAVDSPTKYITGYAVTDAAVHDSGPLLDMLPEKPTDEGWQVHGDSAYIGAETDEELRRRGYDPQMIERATRGRPLTDEQREGNRRKSKIRVRVEHIFGSMAVRGGLRLLRSIGFRRVRFLIGLRNLAYNLDRFVTLNTPKRPKPTRKHPPEPAPA